MVYVFLADGFEIMEAMAPIDILRRAKIGVMTVGVGSKSITSSCGISVSCDITDDKFKYKDVEAIVLPGGQPGTTNLGESETVIKAIKRAYEENAFICAICAAPSILGDMELLNEKEAICFPGYESHLKGATISKNYVITDGNFITAKGAGVAVEFALEIVRELEGSEMAKEIQGVIQCH